MSTTLEELGRRAVACKRWRWMEGMACLWSQPKGAGGQQFSPTFARVAHLPMGPLPATYCLLDVDMVYDHATPDLRDPATLGCLLHLVREAWGDTNIVVLGGWAHVHIYPREEALQAWGYGDGCEQVWDSRGIETEAEALVAALEAAP